MLYICSDCTTRFAPADRCPHCGSTSSYIEGEPMAKSTVHGGASHEGDLVARDAPADAPGALRADVPADEPAEAEITSEGHESADSGEPEGPAEESAPPSADRPADEEPPDHPEPEAPSRPVDSASKADWVAYAVARGLARGDAEAMTKASLIEALG